MSGQSDVHHPVRDGGRYAIEEESDFVQVRRVDRPGSAWRVTTTELLGPSSDGAGLFVEFEALDGITRLARIALQWDASFKAFRANFSSMSTTLGVQAFDLHFGRTCLSFEMMGSSHSVFFNPNSNEIIGNVPTSMLAAVSEVVTQFEEVIEPLRIWINRRERISNCARVNEDDDSLVMFAAGSSKQECKSDRKTGWVKAGALAVGTVAATIATGGALGFVIAIAGGVSVGAEAADTENKYKSCMREAEKEKKE